MIIDLNWTGGLVVGIQQTDQALVEMEEDQLEFCSAIMVHLGFFSVIFLFI